MTFVALLSLLWHSLFAQGIPFNSNGMVHAQGGGSGFDMGFDFRQTSGFVSDATNCPVMGACTYVLGDAYPTSRNGFTFGWEGTCSSLQTRDRNNAIDTRLAGINFSNAESCTFRVDLPSSGSVTITLALGDEGGGRTEGATIQDNSSTLLTYSDTTSCPTQCFIDATAVKRSTSGWPATNVASTQTFSSTIFRFVTDGTNLVTIAHIFLHK